MTDQTDYMQKYDEFWREIVEHPDGTLNRDQVARELFDYSNLIDQATEVYCHVTGDAISKPNTLPGAVIGVHDGAGHGDHGHSRAGCGGVADRGA